MTENINRLPLIGDKAPSFQALTTNGTVNFPEDYKGNWVLFFSHPSDFTPVCTTEFMTLSSMKEEFKAMNVSLLGLSVERACAAAGLAIPKDLSIITFNNSLYSQLASPQLTTVDINSYQLGQEAAVQIISYLDNPNLRTTRVIVPHRIVERSSCARIEPEDK